MPSEICDYSGTDYKNFWSAEDRRYEDLTERLVLRQLLPQKAKNILELGAGFGRLLDEYVGRTKQVVLLDYAANLLLQAKAGATSHNLEVSLINGNIYELPFKNNSFETVVLVRVSHHLEDPPSVFLEIFRVLEPGGNFIFEYANKRHVLAVLKFLFGRAEYNPFSAEPVRRGQATFFNFSPAEIEKQLKQTGFRIIKIKSVSNFRAPFIKKIFSYKILAFFDRLWSWIFTPLRFGPSIFVKALKPE
jgi:ubiquinone/menaquinone biosynthesis C-methylase UbiE